MSGIGWLAAGLRHQVWRKEQMSRYDEKLDHGPTPELPLTVTVRFIDSDGKHLRYQSAPTDKGGYVVLIDDCQDTIKKILAIPHMGQYIRTEIQKIINDEAS